MRGAGHVEEKPIAAPAGPIARLASLAADKMFSMPAAYSIFRKICHVVADSETWPNAAAVARFPRNGVPGNLPAVHPRRKQFTEIPDFLVPMENQPLVIRPVLLDEGLGDFSNR